jgi:hypothetical protein
VTEQVAVVAGAPDRVGRSSLVGLVVAVAGCAVGAVLVLALLVPLVVPLRDLPGFMLRADWQTVQMFAGLVGAGLALTGLVASIAVLFAAGRNGARRRGLVALALSLVALALIVFAWWFVSQPPFLRYGLNELPAAERARLDALGPDAVARTYFDARDPSVTYWLDDAVGRRSWHDAQTDPTLSEFYPPWGLLSGFSDLTVAPLEDREHPADDTRRSFRVAYNRPGEDRWEWYVVLARQPDGPWRVQEIQFP